MAMDRLCNEFTRGFTVIDPAAPVTREVADQFRSKVWSALIDLAGTPSGRPRPVKFLPNSITVNRLMQMRPDVLARWTQHLAWALYYRALPLAEAAVDAADTAAPDNSQRNEELEELKDQLEMCKSQLIRRQDQMIELQSEVSALKDRLMAAKDSIREESVSAVQSAVQSEMRSYSSVVQKECRAVQQNCAAMLAPKIIREAIVSAAEDRSCNLVLHGLQEDKTLDDCTTVKAVLEHLEERPVLEEVSRIGRREEGRTRPVKIVLRNRDTAMRILSKKTQLKESTQYQRVYVAPDRTPEEREERRGLVAELRERRKREEGKRLRIRSGVVEEVPERDLRD